MAQYITRVELHKEQAGDYPKLHAQMETRYFTRQINIGGKWYHLPHATYLSNSTGDLKLVFDLAQAAVSAIGRAGGIVVTQTAGDTAYAGGLLPV